MKATEHPLLWRIGGVRPSYVYGTIHLPDARVLALPRDVQVALQRSDSFYAELPLDHSSTREVDQATRLPEGTTLRDVLPAELYERTDKHFRRYGLRLNALAGRKVWFIAATASSLDYLGEYLFRAPLDKHLWDLAGWHGLERRSLETVSEQLQIFEALTTEEQIQQLAATIAAAEAAALQKTSPARVLVEVYLGGDERQLEEMLVQSANSPTEEKLLKELLDARNIRLTERIAGVLQSEPGKGHFFAVGAGHVVGQDGIVARLIAAGYDVQRVTPAREGTR